MAKTLLVLRRAQRRLGRFHDDDTGVIAILFALILVPMLLAIGISIDYGHASSYQSSMQRVLDETVISAATELAKSNDVSKAEAVAKRRFNATKPTAYEIALNVSIDRESGKVKADAAAQVPMSFMTLAGYKHLEVNARAVAASKRAAPKQSAAKSKAIRQAAASAMPKMDAKQVRDLVYRVEKMCYQIRSAGFASRVPQCRAVFDGSFEKQLRAKLASNGDATSLLPGGVRLVQ